MPKTDFRNFFVGFIILHVVAIMDMDKVKYWTELSDSDLDIAEAMFQSK